MAQHVMRRFRPQDAAAVHRLHAQHAAADHVDVHATIDPVLDVDGVRHRMAAAEWAVLALDRAGSPAGWGAVRSWTEGDGTRVYLTDGYVAPPARRHGLGTRLLRDGEAVAARLAASHGTAGAVVLGGNASTVQPDRAALLERNGYRHVFTMVDMEHDGSPVQPRRLPDGIAVRQATVADAGQLVALAARAWAYREFFRPPTEDRTRDWLRRSELPWFQVATCGERVVALVAVCGVPHRVEIEDVQVDPGFQRRGLAAAMLTQALGALAELGVDRVRLHTDGHDPAGARSLYERLGFRVVRSYHRYRKPLPR